MVSLHLEILKAMVNNVNDVCKKKKKKKGGVLVHYLCILYENILYRHQLRPLDYHYLKSNVLILIKFLQGGKEGI